MANDVCLISFMTRVYLEQESMRRRDIEVDWNGWKFYAKQDIPQQENGHDCGIFMLQVRIVKSILKKQ